MTTRDCASCGTANPGHAKFCLECGTPVDTPAPAEARKTVTLLFADLAGSTSLQERMDPETTRRVMDRLYADLRSRVEEHSGRVVKFTGDGVMAAFGIPEVGEDDAVRAVRAAAAMQEAFGDVAVEIASEHGAPLAMRVGVNTGEVVVSGSDDDVVGDVVNVAARLEQACPEGGVLVGHETWRLCRDHVTFEDVEPLALKGKAEPVPAHLLVSVDPPARERDGAPFVGREAELGRLIGALEDAISERRPRLVTVVGSPGLGKTRLAHEACIVAADRARPLEVRCDPAGVSTYAPIVEAVREIVQLGETAVPDEVVGAIAGALDPDDGERPRIAATIASLFGVGEAAPPQETFWAVRRLFETIARRHPVLLVVDDVQWAEPLLCDLLEYLVEWPKDAPVLLLALARPEVRDVRPTLAEVGGRVADVVHLEGLDPEAIRCLAAELLGAHDLPTELVDRLLDTGEGNPLFVGELMRMLVDDGVLRRDGDRWVLTVDVQDVEVPPTIQAVLATRIERLGAEERAVLERASVIGEEFYRSAVLELVPVPVRTRIDEHLETLRRKELTEPEGGSWIDEPIFRCGPACSRHAAYRRLLKEARAELHERFADWLEHKVGELVGEHEETIGYHLEQAHESRRQLGSLDDAGVELGRRAGRHLAAAAHRALERDDLEAAVALTARALERSDEDDLRAGVLLDRCEALLSTGDAVAAAEAVAELEAVAAGSERLCSWVECFGAELTILAEPSQLHGAADRAGSAAERFAELHDHVGVAKAHAVEARALARLGQIGACEASLDRALVAAREAGDRRRANAILAAAPQAALWGPSSVPRASGRCLDVIRVLRITAGAPAVEATAIRCQAVLEALRGRVDTARGMLEEVRATLTELGFRHALLETDVDAGYLELLGGNPAAAEVYLRRAHEGFGALGADVDTAYAAALLARALLAQGGDVEAEELTGESERLGGDDLKTAIAWRAARAEAFVGRGDARRAIELAREAVELAEGTDALIDHAEAHATLAHALRAAGGHAESAREAARATELLERKGAIAAGAAWGFATTGESKRREASPRGDVRAAAEVTPIHIEAWQRWRAALTASDWEAVAELYDPDLAYVDHRQGLRSESRGREEYVDGQRATWDGLSYDWEIEILEIAGDVGLTRLRAFGTEADAGAWEMSRLCCYRLTSEHTWERAELFDEDDEIGARIRMQQLEPTEAGVRWVVERVTRARFERDWEAIRRLAHPDVVYRDSRSAGVWPELAGVDATIERWKSSSHAFLEYEGWVEDELASSSAEGLFRMAIRGRSRDGGAIESDRLHYVLLEDGRVKTMEHFDPTDETEARSRLGGEEPASPKMPPFEFDNGAVHAFARFEAALNAKDLDAIADLFADDLVHETRRDPMLENVYGHEQYLENVRSWTELPGFEVDQEILATRGERSALSRMRAFSHETSDAGAEWELLHVGEIGFDGRFRRNIIFDSEDLDAAFAALDDVFMAGEGEPYADGVLRPLFAFAEAYESADRPRLETLLEPDFTMVDHRPASFGSIDGRDSYLEVVESMHALTEGLLVRTLTIDRVGAHGTVSRVLFRGADPRSGSVEIAFNCVTTFRGGRLARMEVFPPEVDDEAFDRYEQLVGSRSIGSEAVGVAEGLDNLAVRAHARAQAAMRAKDREGIREVFTEDVVYETRRALMLENVYGREMLVESLGWWLERPGFRYDFEVLATRGERLVLVRVRLSSVEGQGASSEVEVLQIGEVDPAGCVRRVISFEPDDLDDAFATLDELGGSTA